MNAQRNHPEHSALRLIAGRTSPLPVDEETMQRAVETILRFVGATNPDRLSFRLRDGAVTMIEIDEKITGRKIGDVLAENGYQDVVVKKRDGVVVCLQRRRLIRLG